MAGPTSMSRVRHVGYWLTIGLIAAAAIGYFVGSLSWFERPYPGFKLRSDRHVELQLPPSSTGAQAGLRPGDRVVAVNGEPLGDPRRLYDEVARLPIGTPLRYEIERHSPDGRARRLTMTIATQRHDWRLWSTIFLALWLTGLCFLVLGAAVSAWRPGDPLARAHFAFHMAGAVACISIFDQSTTYLAPFSDPYKLLQWLIAVLFMNLALQFPRRVPHFDRAWRLNAGLGLVGAALLVAGYHSGPFMFWVTFAHLGYIALAELVLIGNALWTIRSARSERRQRGQGQVLLVGTVASIVPALLVPQALTLGLNLDFEGLESFAQVLWPLAISWAIMRHQLFDIRPLVRRSVIYLAAALVLTVLYVGSVTAVGAIVGSQTSVPGIVATVLTAVAFVPVRDAIKTWLDARFFRSPYSFDAVIARFTKAAQENVDPHVLVQAYFEALHRALAPSGVALQLQSGATHGQLDGGPALVQPLVVQGHRLGEVQLGPKKSDLAYSERDRALVRELSQLLAVWINLFERFEKVRLQSQEIEALKRSEAMQGQFLNLVSHELKIPLSVILSSLNLLERPEAQHDARTRNHLGRIRRSLTHLVGLVGDLLHAGQLQSGQFHLHPRSVDMAAIVAETAAELRPLAENKGQTLEVEVAAEMAPVWGDEARLAQVLRNLIHNAIRHSPSGGAIRVSLSAGPDGLRCEVRDEGPGVEAEAMPRLFQRFSRLDEGSGGGDQGVGLGLYISRSIVEAHGGAIGVVSEPGQGAAFWFTLPVASGGS